MVNVFAAQGSRLSLMFSLLMTVGLSAAANAQSEIYNPKPLPASNEITDTLSQKDIPTGEGGFARDYIVQLNEGDNVVIDLSSDQFDTMVTLLSDDGTTVSENDDGTDGSTNSLLFARISKSGSYIVRVRAFGETSGGPFNLKVTRLRPI